jgi:regulator of protease activity HflC (stomatin/prohibitin superfamily)
LNRQFEPQGVEITDVMITDVKLPTEITQQMYNKTLVISSNAHEIMTQQFEMQDVSTSLRRCSCNYN